MHCDFGTTLRAALGGAALGLAITTTAQADITTTVSGFGTVGGTFSGDGNYTYHHDASEFTGASNQFDVGLESRLGLQAKFDFGSGLSVTAQEVVRQRGDRQFDPGMEWLYAQYSPEPDLQIRLGRIVLGAFMFSDTRQVGYAVPWFRAPSEVYGQLPFDYLDGGQVQWQKSLGRFIINLEASYGSTQGTFETGTLTIVSHSKDMLNTMVSVEYGSLLLRVARTSLNVPTDLPLTATFSVDYQLHENFTNIGVQYDDGRALVLGEWAKTAQNQAPVLNEPLTASSQWYLAGGWHFGKFLPMLIYGNVKEDQSLLATPRSFGTWSANLRYDVTTGIALKAEISRPQAANGQYWITPDLNSTARVNVYSVGADFVF